MTWVSAYLCIFRNLPFFIKHGAHTTILQQKQISRQIIVTYQVKCAPNIFLEKAHTILDKICMVHSSLRSFFNWWIFIM